VFVVNVMLSSALLANISVSAPAPDHSICLNGIDDRTSPESPGKADGRLAVGCQICAAFSGVVLTPEAPDVFQPIAVSRLVAIGAVQLAVKVFLPSDQHARDPPKLS
jgi:hypothetical protein